MGLLHVHKTASCMLSTAPAPIDVLGVSLVIDGYEPGIEVWYADYSNWLEEKLEEYEKKNKEGQ